MNYRDIRTGEVYLYRAKEGAGYSRYEGRPVKVARKTDRQIRLVEIEFLDGPRQGQKRILSAVELEPVADAADKEKP